MQGFLLEVFDFAEKQQRVDPYFKILASNSSLIKHSR
jgi:hypothetical protein